MILMKGICLFFVIAFGIQMVLQVMAALKNHPGAKVQEYGVIIFSGALAVLLTLCGVFG